MKKEKCISKTFWLASEQKSLEDQIIDCRKKIDFLQKIMDEIAKEELSLQYRLDVVKEELEDI